MLTDVFMIQQQLYIFHIYAVGVDDGGGGGG
jgi:hypothetical protein